MWEVTDITYESANEITKKYKIPEVTKQTVCETFGCNREESAKFYFPQFPLETATKLLDEVAIVKIKNLKEQGGRLYPMVKDIIKELQHKYDLFIVSNTAEDEYIEAFLNTAGLQNEFKGYIAASKLKLSKADAILKVIQDNNLKSAIYVGDTIKDKEASESANIPFIQAQYGFGKNLNTEYSIENIQQLPEVLRKMESDNS